MSPLQQEVHLHGGPYHGETVLLSILRDELRVALSEKDSVALLDGDENYPTSDYHTGRYTRVHIGGKPTPYLEWIGTL